jgi:serine phosphatase RsbU (regulator of sigma subunit)
MSDGFPETFNEDGEMFGYDRAAALLAEVCTDGCGSQAVIEHFEKAARDWAAGHPPDDDITFVVLKMRERAES